MNYKRAINNGIITAIVLLGFGNARYNYLNNDLPKDKTLIESNNIEIKEVYEPKVFCGLIPTVKKDTSYSATFTQNYKARDGSNHPFKFQDVNIDNLFSYNPDNSHLKGLDRKSDSCYKVLGGSIDKKYSESYKKTIENLLAE